MAWTRNPPCTIPARSCIAQFIPLPILPDTEWIPSVSADRGTGGFGSTGAPHVYWSKSTSVQQPFLACLVDGKSSTGLTDTRANKTIISECEWPQTWPLSTPSAMVTDVGGQQMSQQSAKELMVYGQEGKQAQLKPHVLSTTAHCGEEICYPSGD